MCRFRSKKCLLIEDKFKNLCLENEHKNTHKEVDLRSLKFEDLIL